jgi:N-acetylmuramoyl-L-alanine amidase
VVPNGRPHNLEQELTNYLGAGGMSAFAGAMLLTLGGSGQAFAQQVNNLPVVRAVVNTTNNAVSAATAPATVARPYTYSTAPDPAREAGTLLRNGWPLYALVDRYAAGAPLTDQAHCIAVAVYHEARGETVEGQLAVAKVIMNRAASGKYPATWCGVVKQPWQFSFVNARTGYMPSVDQASDAWRKALGVTRLAVANAVPTVSSDCLWYHADYVAPAWGRRLTRVNKIGAHIFYRA